ncbi:Aldose 1-epimerase [Pedobacter cryoconitis]|uniref:Aldose 1-epimerase n=1 Tax=Pedobacter cryoconitis TaxID=188932 RepID=A0A127V8H3_9SPHI|nr:aldose epimerase family protein [Pedobacter cryoconitis]AMP97570.1 Aldose 1-epimerase [Pedobacter cryoconitis]
MNKNYNLIYLSIILLLTLTRCESNSSPKSKSVTTDSASVSKYIIPEAGGFEGNIDGKAITLYTLKNKNGAEAAITNYGGRLVSLLVPDRKQKLTDVVLGYDSLKSYQKKGEPYFGAIIGRYGNRIAKGKFVLDGKSYQLQVNDGTNTLHGGADGFYSKVWTAKKTDAQTLELSYLAKDNEAGYPGNLTVKVTYKLTDDNALMISYSAVTDKTTIVNLTNHAYFNLNGAGNQTITDHLLTIEADAYTPVDKTLIPTGKIEKVSGTPFDFTKPTLIGERINDKNEQLEYGKGYDHNFVLRSGSGLRKAATVMSPKTGIAMEVLTTEPGIQFYSGNFLTGKDQDGKGKVSYAHRSAFCLETQHFPDAPNQPSFPATVLKPGKVYQTTTVYKFSALK